MKKQKMNTLKLLKDVLQEESNYILDIYQNAFKSDLFHFELNTDLYSDLIEKLEKNGFKIFRVSPKNKITIKVVVRYDS